MVNNNDDHSKKPEWIKNIYTSVTIAYEVKTFPSFAFICAWNEMPYPAPEVFSGIGETAV